MSKSPFSTLMPSNLASTNLASTLRDAAEVVVDATTASAKSISAALPDSMPELAASLPAVIPFVSHQRSRRRSLQVRRVIIVGAVVALVVGVTIVLRNRAQRQANDVTED
jgi:hypothetical protein